MRAAPWQDDPRQHERQYRHRLRHDRRGEGYPVKLYLPANVSPERIAILRAYGAELI
ncbi:MAG: hypothetical protein U0521_15325 [Anaerolineae bacterium]